MTQNTAAELRKRLKEARQHLAVADRQRGSLLIRARLYTWLAILRDQKKAQGLNQPQTIACYWPLPDEPDITPLATQWDDAGLTVALPRMVA
ncbi:MAG: 5-formyltetrahydrofolate cyclo-ligase, partial [Orrella sp.]